MWLTKINLADKVGLKQQRRKLELIHFLTNIDFSKFVIRSMCTQKKGELSLPKDVVLVSL